MCELIWELKTHQGNPILEAVVEPGCYNIVPTDDGHACNFHSNGGWSFGMFQGSFMDCMKFAQVHYKSFLEMGVKT